MARMELISGIERRRRWSERWPRSPGQFGGDDKLFPGSDYAASFMLAAITTAGACPGGGDGGLM